MSLTDEEKTKIEEEERVRAEARAKYTKPMEVKIKKKTSCIAIGCGTIFALFVLSIVISAIRTPYNTDTSSVTGNNTPIVATGTPAEQAAKAAKEKADEAAWTKTKAGKLCAKNPEWSKNDCQNIINNKIWIGMDLNMLKAERGTPSSANPSNYGGKTQWQWCWDNYTPSCFYGERDGIITAYN
jgi:hypothetical protein